MYSLKMPKTACFAGLLLTAAAATTTAADFSAVPSGQYALDSTHAYINFQYNHLGFSNPTLSFDDFSVDLNLNADDPTQSSVNVTVDVNSVVTGSEIFHDHLTGGDWFDVANNPEITFQSTSMAMQDDGSYKVMGDLTVKGMTKPLELTVMINGAKNHPMSGKPVVGLDAAGQLLRSDFGLGKHAPFVGDDVAVSLSIEMVAAQ
ncbi:MAG: YceI family protein [Pseudomonadota bacterium]